MFGNSNAIKTTSMFGNAPEKATGLFGVQSYTAPTFGTSNTNATGLMFNNFNNTQAPTLKISEDQKPKL
jgi:hypothetical protein